MDRFLVTFVNGETQRKKKRAKCDNDENVTPSSEENLSALTPLEQVCFFELYQKYGSDPQVRDMETQVPLKAKDPKARDMLVMLMMVDRQHMTQQLAQMNGLYAQIKERDEKIAHLEKTLTLLFPIEKILKENKEMQTLVFKQSGEKRTLEETLRKLEVQLADITTRVSEQFRNERDSIRKNAIDRMNEEYWNLTEFINKILYKREQKEVSVVTTNEVRDAVINFADKIRLILHPI